MELSAKLSLDKVEAYAREKLGMAKNDAPVACINIPQDNEVLLANGKSRQSNDASDTGNAAHQDKDAGSAKTQSSAGANQEAKKPSAGSAFKDFLEYLF